MIIGLLLALFDILYELPVELIFLNPRFTRVYITCMS